MSLFRELLLCAMISAMVAAATIQAWETFKPPIKPIPTNPTHIELPKEMLVNYEHVFIGWGDPNAWMLRPEAPIHRSYQANKNLMRGMTMFIYD